MSTLAQDNSTCDLIQKTLNRFLHSVLAQHPMDRSLSESCFRNVWKSLADHGLHGVAQQFAQAGLDCPHRVVWDIIRSISTVNPGIGLSYLAHNVLTVQPIAQYGHTIYHKRLLARLMSGDIGGCAISESQAGSDIMSMRTTAKPHAQGYVLDGEKIWITNAPFADVLLVYAKIATPDTRELGVFVIDTKQSGVDLSLPMTKIGMHPSPTGIVRFDSVLLPAESRLDTADVSSKRILFQQLDYERLMLAAGCCGIMDWCVDTSQRYTSTRVQFSQAINRFQFIQGHLADMYTSQQSSSAYAHAGLSKMARKELDQRYAASVYLFCAEQALAVADLCVQCLGATGYMQESLAGQYYLDSKLYTIGGGTTEIRRWIIGRE